MGLRGNRFSVLQYMTVCNEQGYWVMVLRDCGVIVLKDYGVKALHIVELMCDYGFIGILDLIIF